MAVTGIYLGKKSSTWSLFEYKSLWIQNIVDSITPITLYLNYNIFLPHKSVEIFSEYPLPPWNCFLVEIPIRPWCAQLICLLPDSWDNPLWRLLLRLLKNRFWGSFQIVVLRIFQLRRSQILVEGLFWFWYMLYRNKSGVDVVKQKN